MAYKTKTQKRNALKSVLGKSSKLYMAGAMSIQSFEKIRSIVDGSLKRLK